MMRTLILTALMIVLTAGTANAQTSGKDMLEPCRNQILPTPPGKVTPPHELVLQGRCAGMIEALAYVGRDLPEPRRNCTPDGPAGAGMQGVVVSYLVGHRDRLNDRFMDLVLAALAAKWPCPKQ
jgi:hypothetical protein